jgi:hypothetical protein
LPPLIASPNAVEISTAPVASTRPMTRFTDDAVELVKSGDFICEVSRRYEICCNAPSSEHSS